MVSVIDVDQEEEGRRKKEEEIETNKKITKIELDELARLNIIAGQAPDRLIGTINLQAEAKKNWLDYHMELSKKYQFNPKKIGIDRKTGELRPIPKEVLRDIQEDTKKKNKSFQKFMRQIRKGVIKTDNE